jgi:hypothetical protein
MVLSETLGLWLSSIVREGIGFLRRLGCLSTGLTLPVDTSPRNRASQEPDGHRREKVPRENGLSARGAQAACGFK